ncbi:MAG: tetratricopeptide repeat protein [Myxococcales bacterium]|nr:tetratricopeptide repeat protein [Myxococcales bacterium]
MLQMLFAAQSLFSLWMLVDAIQRRADRYWYFVVLLPFGEWFYFFTVKIHDPQFRGIKQAFASVMAPKISLAHRRRLADETPSFANKLALAQAYHDEGRTAEAAAMFEELLVLDEQSKHALYGLGLCRFEQGNYEGAIDALSRLVELKPSFAEYEPWGRLANALSKADRLDDAVQVLSKLVRTSPRLRHRVAYARYLARAGRCEEARDELHNALLDDETAPRYQRRLERKARREAKGLLAML